MDFYDLDEEQYDKPLRDDPIYGGDAVEALSNNLAN